MAGHGTASDFPKLLKEFAFFPYRGPTLPQIEAQSRAWPNVLSELAHLAEKEDWTGTKADGTPATPENQILNNYISYTYQRLVIQEKITISDNGEYVTFNTGLLDLHEQKIFGFFHRNRKAQAGKQDWLFIRWVVESDRDFMNNFSIPPNMAEYVTASADLVYDYRRQLVLDYAHVLVDNLDRFPLDLQKHPCRARMGLDAAVARTLKRLRRNYKLAIPQWYPRLGKEGAQLLLPLDLTGSGTADLALVVGTAGDRYRAGTVLSLEMAYSNARLVARPDSEWLQPLSTTTTTVDDQLDPTSLNIGTKREHDSSWESGRKQTLSPQAQQALVYGRR
ncbi:uncharacterized protein N0V89_003817 [Didymosphaeria variabile]|uniref:DUF3825 domain-containing protein n=1 Tax=Didymosphaeria variabile TaxID=1932322 RepID=A0A9W9CD21_9PLEO|nr:uncharacterized protein N0V89_003817 [Didymosphaeria variabile]KAJ4355796.1 hypothetical protein N0V89_003817 [Didymosphaeria variabile]